MVKEILGMFAVIIILSYLIVALLYGNFWFWAPKFEEVRKDVYDNSRTFQEGTVREMRKLCTDYDFAEPPHKPAIRVLILDEWDRLSRAGVELPLSLQPCIDRIQ